MPNIAASFSLAATHLLRHPSQARASGSYYWSHCELAHQWRCQAQTRAPGGGLAPACRVAEAHRRQGLREGRQTVTKKMITVLIEQQPMLDRGRIDTDRADNTTLTILDQLAILDSDTFRWGDPPHTYRVKSIDGVISNEATGTRFSSSVVCH